MLFKHFINDCRLLSPAGRVLVINGFTFNLGFYMLLPYLADHLQHDLGITGWFVGAIIGLRVLSQQGLFLVGGTLGDLFGYKRLILLGCAIRIVGFALLGIGQTVPVLLLGAFCSGFAGALFTPSSQAYLASEYPHQNQRQKVLCFAKPDLGSWHVVRSFGWLEFAGGGFCLGWSDIGWIIQSVAHHTMALFA